MSNSGIAATIPFIRNGILIVGVSTIFFVAANVIAYGLMLNIHRPVSMSVFDAVEWPESAVGHGVLPQVLGTQDWKSAIRYFEAAPNFAVHPSLSFITQPIKNEYYAIGVEGIRQESQWSDNYVKELLAGNNHLIFAFGGSTMLGHGVGDQQTLPHFLNEMLKDTGWNVLNFGSQAYDFHRSIDKLLYMLRNGYRPDIVVFLVGWNDIIGMARSNLRVADKLVFHGFSTNRGEIAFTPGDRIGDRQHLKLFLESLPVYRLLESYSRRSFSVDDISPERDTYSEGFSFYEAEYVFTHWADFAERHPGLLKNQILESYSASMDFLHDLSRAFGFKLYVFYQPIGLLDQTNPFVTDRARQARGYNYVVEMDKEIRTAIYSDRLSLIDISQSLEDLSEPRYIDVAHYSPFANKVLARQVFNYVKSLL